MACHNLKWWRCWVMQPPHGMQPGPSILVPLLLLFLTLQSSILLLAHLEQPYSAQFSALSTFTTSPIALGRAALAPTADVAHDVATIRDCQDFSAGGALSSSRRGQAQRSTSEHPPWHFTLPAWRALSRRAHACRCPCIVADWMCVDGSPTLSAPVVHYHVRSCSCSRHSHAISPMGWLRCTQFRGTQCSSCAQFDTIARFDHCFQNFGFLLSNLHFSTLFLSTASALRHRSLVASHVSARGWAVGKKKEGQWGATLHPPLQIALAMLRAARTAPAAAAARNAANPTLSLDHLQQVRFDTQAADALRVLAPAAKAASDARLVQEQIVRDWKAERENTTLNVVNRRQNLCSCISRRAAASGFLRPTAMIDDNSCILRRADTPATLSQAVTALRGLRQSLLQDNEFWKAVHEQAWVAEFAAVFHTAAPVLWQSA
eukprot:2962040-Rhodomonas_salina.1